MNRNNETCYKGGGKEINERIGRNLASGDDLMIESKKVVTFKCSGRLRRKINKM